jgi:hypothetical protein
VISKAEADRLADELLEQASKSPFGVTDPSGMPVPPLYQCRELGRLPQGVQSEIVRRTTLRVGASPLFILAVVAWIALIALFYAREWTLFGATPITFLILAPMAPLLLRALLVRRAVRRVARQVAASWPVPVRL